MSKIVKIVKIVENCQKISKISKIVKISQNCQNVGQFMFPHHSDQMSQRSQVSRVALCMSISKVLSESVSQSVSDKVTYILSCSGQLKKKQDSFISV